MNKTLSITDRKALQDGPIHGSLVQVNLEQIISPTQMELYSKHLGLMNSLFSIQLTMEQMVVLVQLNLVQ